MKSAKIAISIPESTLEELEKERIRLGKSRSSVITIAIESWLKRQVGSAQDRRYAEAYLRKPEPIEHIETIAQAAAGSWEPWQ